MPPVTARAGPGIALASNDHIIARLTSTAVPKATGQSVVFKISGFSRSRAAASSASKLYADTAVTITGARES